MRTGQFFVHNYSTLKPVRVLPARDLGFMFTWKVFEDNHLASIILKINMTW
jgi:hypothetical protein